MLAQDPSGLKIRPGHPHLPPMVLLGFDLSVS